MEKYKYCIGCEKRQPFRAQTSWFGSHHHCVVNVFSELLHTRKNIAWLYVYFILRHLSQRALTVSEVPISRHAFEASFRLLLFCQQYLWLYLIAEKWYKNDINHKLMSHKQTKTNKSHYPFPHSCDLCDQQKYIRYKL